MHSGDGAVEDDDLADHTVELGAEDVERYARWVGRMK